MLEEDNDWDDVGHIYQMHVQTESLQNSGKN